MRCQRWKLLWWWLLGVTRCVCSLLDWAICQRNCLFSTGTVVTKWLLSMWLCQPVLKYLFCMEPSINLLFWKSASLCWLDYQSIWEGINELQGYDTGLYKSPNLLLREVCLRCCCPPWHWCPGSTFSSALQQWLKRGSAFSQGLAWNLWLELSRASTVWGSTVEAVWWSVSTSAQQGDVNVLVGSYSREYLHTG